MLFPFIDIEGKDNEFFASIIGIIFFVVGILLFFKMYNNIYFIIGPNTLTVTKKAVCGKMTTIYNPGELLRVEFNYNRAYNPSNAKNNYELIVVPTNSQPDRIISLGSACSVFTIEEIDYFLYHINSHIQTKMRV